MERLSYSSRCALVIELARKLRSRGSWAGETHLQKAFYILQDLSKSNFGYKFVIYKHGPYSFDLNNELGAMRAANIVEFEFTREGYGPTIVPTPFGERVRAANMENVETFEPLLDFISEWFGASDVRHLEKIATAYYVTKKNPRDPAIERAKKLNALKPHIDIRTAEDAVRIVDEKRKPIRHNFSRGRTRVVSDRGSAR
jgi:hypothetical protein